jgi:hypothetical protein
MTINEQKIGGYSGSNVPGILSLYVIDLADVLSVQDPQRHRLPGATPSRLLAGDIILKTGAMITKFKFPPLACGFTQVSEAGDGGITFTQSIDFAIPGSREDIMDFYNTNCNKQWLCLMEDGNRRAWVVGNEQRGLRMSLSQSITSANTHSVSFYLKTNVPAFVLETAATGLVLADHFADVEFGIEFANELNA